MRNVLNPDNRIDVIRMYYSISDIEYKVSISIENRLSIFNIIDDWDQALETTNELTDKIKEEFDTSLCYKIDITKVWDEPGGNCKIFTNCADIDQIMNLINSVPSLLSQESFDQTKYYKYEDNKLILLTEEDLFEITGFNNELI